MKILVTGAGGFLGFHVAEELIKAGHEVINFSRTHKEELDSIGVKTRVGNLKSLDDIEKALIGIDAVFHVASLVGMWGKWEDFHQTNTMGTIHLINAMKEKGIKYLVYTSTPSVVFDSSDIEDADETKNYPPRFFNHYSRSKAMAEKAVLVSNSDDLKTVALRPHLIYGERDQNLIPGLVKAKSSGRLKIIGDGKNRVDIIYVKNAAVAHVQAFVELMSENSKVAGKAYFLGQEKPVMLWDFFNQVLEIYQETPLTKKVPLSLAFGIGAIFEFVYKTLGIFHRDPPMTRFIALNLAKSHYFSHDRAKADFAYSPEISISESLERLKKYLKN